MKTIPLNGLEAFVDDDTFEDVCAYKWHARKHRRGWIVVARIDGRDRCLHRFVTNAPPKQIVTFKNRNPLDCTRENLAFVTSAYVVRHGKPTCPNRSSRFRGVTFVKRSRRPWRAQMRLGKQVVRLGSFSDEAEAARAYDEAQRKHFGDDAILNFPTES